LRDRTGSGVRARCEMLPTETHSTMSTGSMGGPSRCSTRTASWRASSAVRRAGTGGLATPGCLPEGDAFGPFPTSYGAHRDALTSIRWREMLSRTAGACSPRQAARLLPGPTDTPRTPWAAHRGRAYAGHDLVGAGTRQPLVRSGAGGCVGLCLAFLPPPHAHLRVWWVAPMIRLRGRCALIPKVRAVGRPFVSHAVVSAGDGCGDIFVAYLMLRHVTLLLGQARPFLGPRHPPSESRARPRSTAVASSKEDRGDNAGGSTIYRSCWRGSGRPPARPHWPFEVSRCRRRARPRLPDPALAFRPFMNLAKRARGRLGGDRDSL
jgi:hypothetical protein